MNSWGGRTNATSWEDAAAVLQSFSSMSRISPGRSPVAGCYQRTGLSSETNRYVCSESTYNSNSAPLKINEEIHMENVLSQEQSSSNTTVPGDKPKFGMGRGRFLKILEKNRQPTRAALDINIHSELREIGYGFSNEVIEESLGYSSEDLANDSSSISEEQEKDSPETEAEIVLPDKSKDVNVDSLIDRIRELQCGTYQPEPKGADYSIERTNVIHGPEKAHYSTKETHSKQNADDLIKGPLLKLCADDSTKTTQMNENADVSTKATPLKQSSDDSTKTTAMNQNGDVLTEATPSKQNTRRKCRNFVLLNLSKTENGNTPGPVLQPPQSFLKFETGLRYSTAISQHSKSQPVPCNQKEEFIFSDNDFPAL